MHPYKRVVRGSKDLTSQFRNNSAGRSWLSIRTLGLPNLRRLSRCRNETTAVSTSTTNNGFDNRHSTGPTLRTGYYHRKAPAAGAPKAATNPIHLKRYLAVSRASQATVRTGCAPNLRPEASTGGRRSTVFPNFRSFWHRPKSSNTATSENPPTF